MDVNFMKMHDPTHAAPRFAGKSGLGDYSGSFIERRVLPPASAFAKETASSSTRRTALSHP
jgi:hypothetical protein